MTIGGVDISDVRPKVEIINGLFRIEVAPGAAWLWQDRAHGLEWLSTNSDLAPTVRPFSQGGLAGVELVDQDGQRLTFRGQFTGSPASAVQVGESGLGEWLLEQVDEDERGGLRPLAECDAKRQIVELHAAEPGQHPDFCGHDGHELPCPTLRLVALPYADRPGYREEWRP